MRAAVLHAPHDLRVEDRPEPTCGDGEVVIEVIYNGLCGTDATEYTKGPMMVPLSVPHPGSGHVGPTTLGHEFIGRVVEAGAGAEQWKGRRVASGAGVSCGECAWCLRGRTNLCARYYTLGLSTHGGLAQLVAAPAGTLREIPAGCTDLDAALAQPLAVGLHALARAGVQPGDNLVLLGAGAIGTFILAGLSGREASVLALDIDEGRLAVARGLGATETQVIERDATPGQLRDLVPAGADVVIECSGVPGGAARAYALAARGGTVLLVGLTQAPQPLQLADVVLREVDTRTTVAHVCDTDLPAALDLLTTRPLAPVLVDRVVALEDVVPEGFEPLAAGAAHGKILVAPDHG
ncbi:MAG: (R,R)-butanediol dehydrogenase / meso-butanediol dehydrogenase / diacetyl reductase [Actinomycetota bacterium]|jgi:(R,R)-butanediol dehydrogenase/meso-butanediol dehydrogenase/diacetyl reductase|nr:(R,R)-butanediol dehydrogenase / meso-butanediol dehydrogenase / diacetyl reductase [Actinomycetota bacterium]